MIKRIVRKIGLAVLLVFLCGVTYFAYRLISFVINTEKVISEKKELVSKEETFKGDSKDLKDTVILPALNSPVIKGKNNIWCSTFQLAWNEMKDTVIKEPIQVQGAEEIAGRLNTGAQSKEDLSEESYFIAAGVTLEVVQKIRAELPQQFPFAEIPDFNDLPGDGLLSYSYLDTYIKFKETYRQYETALKYTDSRGNITHVSSFGAWEGYQDQYKSLCEQIDLLYVSLDEDIYNGIVNECAIDLCRFSTPYQIVISIVDLESTLQQTYNKLQVRIKEFQNKPLDEEVKKSFSEYDILQVPDLYWEITHHFSELEDKLLLNKAYYEWPIVKASQVIRFRLDRSGVRLDADAVLASSAMPRNFKFNQPFLLYLKKRDAEQPFFVMWVDNAELLTAF